METCPHCGRTAPDANGMAIHLERFCAVLLTGKAAMSADVHATSAVAADMPATPAKNGASAVATALAAVANIDPVDAVPADEGIWYPAVDQNFYPAADVNVPDFADRAVKMSLSAPVNVLVRGDTGTGKTTFAQQVAAVFHRPYASVEFGKLQEVSQVFGETRFDPKRGTYYVKSLLWRALETPGCVVLCDEINRVENPKVLNGLMSLLDDRRSAYIDELGVTIRVAPEVVIIATCNEGWEFVGIDPVDKALKSRFEAKLRLKFPPRQVIINIITAKTGLSASKAATLLGIVAPGSAAENIPPLRDMLSAAKHLVLGSSYRDAILSSCDMDQKAQEGVLQRAMAAESGVTVSTGVVKWPK